MTSAEPDDSHVIDGIDVDALVAAVRGCPSVSGMAGGGLGGATTLLPGRRVTGVRVTGGVARVEVRARWGATAAVLGREVRVASAPLLAGRGLHVVINDIDDPPSEPLNARSGSPIPDRPSSPS